ncbi:hypothetical protein ACHAXT_002649 [Thalassiosira profunda]
MLRLALVAVAASGASAALWGDGDNMGKNFQDALERRHTLAAQHRKGNERRASDTEPGPSRMVRQLKRNRDDMEEGSKKGMLEGLQMGAAHSSRGAHGRAPKTEKGNPPAKAPSSGGKKSSKGSPSSPSSPSRGKTDKGSGKSRKVSSGICDKRLEMAFDLIEPLANSTDSPFGLVESPADVTDLCFFEPPNEPEDNNLGCPFFYIPNNDMGIPSGFLTTEEEYVDTLGEAGPAFWQLLLYCQCYQGFELGCAAQIPHGPPTSMVQYASTDGTQKDVLANGYSEFIPASTPGERAEYCKMVGVWNGDFDSDVANEFTPEVDDCGCYFVGQAKDMVSQCPGVDLGAFFVFPREDDGPATSPMLDEPPYDFEDGSFPSPPWSVDNGEFDGTDASEPAAIMQNEASNWSFRGNRRLREEKDAKKKVDVTKFVKASRQKARRRLDGHLDWALTDEESFDGDYSITSPDLSDSESPRYASVTLDIGALEDEGIVQLPALLDFASKLDFPNNSGGDVFEALLVVVDGVIVLEEIESSGWDRGSGLVDEGTRAITWEYVFIPNENPSGSVYLDDIFIKDAPIPTSDVEAESIRRTPTDWPTPSPDSDYTAWPTPSQD